VTITNRVSLKSVMAGNTPVPDVVDAPTIGTATADAESATVTFTAAATGGAATSFGAISTPGSVTGTSATSPITVSGLTVGTAYTFKTYGINSSGTWSNVLSASSNSVTPFVSTAFASIATTNVGAGGTASIAFSSIPQTYTHLQIRGITRNTSADNKVIIQFNGDTTSTNYWEHAQYGSGGGVGSWGNNNNWLIYGPETGNTANVFAPFVIDIYDYASTDKQKTIKVLTGFDANGAGYAWINSLLWTNTGAISSITLRDNASSNLAQYSSYALYGIKG
jgi:hypothetical protein